MNYEVIINENMKLLLKSVTSIDIVGSSHIFKNDNYIIATVMEGYFMYYMYVEKESLQLHEYEVPMI